MLYSVGEGNTRKYYKVGLMTADEGAFAGLVYNINHPNVGGSYLFRNSTSTWWWTMTPTHKSGSVYNNMLVGSVLRLIDDANLTNTGGGVRPMISLKADVVVTGKGSKADPYVVHEAVNTHNLPSDYQEVTYIQNKTGEYIDVGMGFSNGFHMVADVELITTTAGFIIGAEDIIPYNRNYLAYNGKWQLGNYAATNIGSTLTLGNYSLDVSTIHGSINLSVNGSSIYSTNSTSAARSGRNLYIFKNNTLSEYGAGLNVSPYRLYSMKLYTSADTSTLVRDFIPCFRKSDGKIGLYDLAGSQFYPLQT